MCPYRRAALGVVQSYRVRGELVAWRVVVVDIWALMFRNCPLGHLTQVSALARKVRMLRMAGLIVGLMYLRLLRPLLYPAEICRLGLYCSSLLVSPG